MRYAILAFTACTTSVPPISKPEPPVAQTEDIRDERFVEPIRTAATTYTTWGRVDESPNIAPELCRMPTRDDHGAASHVRRSLAPEGHGTKLYYLWASQRAKYLNAKVTDGFSIVKQAFIATRTPATEGKPIGLGRISEPVGWVEEGDQKWFTGAPAGLYVMTKVGGEGTDLGWVYGTVSASGDVTSAGRVASCMGCHEAATHGRLFGLQKTKTLVDLAPKR